MLEEGPAGRAMISSGRNVKAKRRRAGLAWRWKGYPGIMQ